MRCNKFILLITAILLGLGNSTGQIYTQTKSLEKSYIINSSTTVDITNKYGKISLLQWDKDSVRFEIKVSVETNNQLKLESLLDNVDFSFVSNNYYLKVKTIFKSDNSLLSDIMKLTDLFLTAENTVTVDYTVYAPSYLNFKIENKYGDIYIENIQNELNLNLANGNLKADNLSGNSIITINFSDNALIKSMNTGEITVDYSDLEVKSAEQLNIISKSAKIEIEEINILTTDSKRDKYYINSVGYLYGITYFSDFKVVQLSSEVDMDLLYGDFDFEKIEKTISLVNFKAMYNDLDIELEKGIKYSFDLTHIKADIDLPDDFDNLEQKTLQDGSIILFGNIGSTIPKTKFSFELEGGSLTISYE